MMNTTPYLRIQKYSFVCIYILMYANGQSQCHLNANTKIQIHKKHNFENIVAHFNSPEFRSWSIQFSTSLKWEIRRCTSQLQLIIELKCDCAMCECGAGNFYCKMAKMQINFFNWKNIFSIWQLTISLVRSSAWWALSTRIHFINKKKKQRDRELYCPAAGCCIIWFA